MLSPANGNREHELVKIEDFVEKLRAGSIDENTQVWMAKWGKNWQFVNQSPLAQITLKPAITGSTGTPPSVPKSDLLKTKRFSENQSARPARYNRNNPSRETKRDVGAGLSVADVSSIGNVSQNIESKNSETSVGNQSHPSRKGGNNSLSTGGITALGDVSQKIVQTNIYNTDDTKELVECVVTGEQVRREKTNRCNDCNGYAIREKFNRNKKLCEICDKKEERGNERIFRSKIKDFLSDDIIEDHELVELYKIASEFGYSNEFRDKIIGEEKEKHSLNLLVELGPTDGNLFKDAQRALEMKNDPKLAFDTLGSLPSRYPRNKDVTKFFLLLASECSPQAGLEFLANNELYKHTDSPHKSVRKLEMLCALGRREEVAEIESTDFSRFPNNALVISKILERKIDLFLEGEQEDEQREDVMQYAKIKFSQVKDYDPSYHPFVQFVEEYLKFFNGERKDLNPETEKDPAKIFLLRKQRQGIGVSKDNPYINPYQQKKAAKVLFDLPPPAVFSGEKNGTYQNGDKYEGSWLNGKRNGYGSFVTELSTFEGNWVDDKKNGYGRETFIDGCRYEGEFVDNLFEGKGKEWLADESRYEGLFKNGKRNGNGSIFSKVGKLLYQGQMQENRVHGQAKKFFEDGRVEWEGEFVNGEPHGQVKNITNSGRKFVGVVSKGIWQKGELYEKNGTKTYEGDFRNGKYHGRGKLCLNGVVSEGEFNNNTILKGKRSHANGDTFEGSFHNSNGYIKKGIYRFKDGRVYNGECNEQGKWHGRGKLTFTDGGTWEGEWKNGELDGKNGKIILADGGILQGKFVKGILRQGTYQSIDGTIYKGGFDENGKKHGLAKQIQPDGKIFDGNWVHGEWKGGTSREKFFTPKVIILSLLGLAVITFLHFLIIQIGAYLFDVGWINAIFWFFEEYIGIKPWFFGFILFSVIGLLPTGIGFGIIADRDSGRFGTHPILLYLAFALQFLAMILWNFQGLWNWALPEPVQKAVPLDEQMIVAKETAQKAAERFLQIKSDDGDPEDVQEAADELKKAKERLEELKIQNKRAIIAKAQEIYAEGYKLLHGSGGIVKDPKKGMDLLNQAAREGSHEAAYHLASCLYTGKEMKKNPQAARQWFEYAAKLGSPKAKEFLKKWDSYSKAKSQ